MMRREGLARRGRVTVPLIIDGLWRDKAIFV